MQTVTSSNADQMTRNKETVKRTVNDLFNRGNVDAVDEIFASDFIDHSQSHSALGGAGAHREGFKQMVRAVRSAFADFNAEIDFLIAEGDFVAMCNHASGLHRAEFMGISPTNKQINMVDFHIFRLRDGKIVEHWNQLNTLDILQQLGAMAKSA